MSPRSLLPFLAIFTLASPNQAQEASLLDGGATLDDLRMTVTVGPDWVDVEEDARIQVNEGWAWDLRAPWTVRGLIPGARPFVGVLLQTGDTMYQGRLLAKGQASLPSDSLVPLPADGGVLGPVLLEPLPRSCSEFWGYHGLRLHPVRQGVTSRVRIRHLSQRVLGSGTHYVGSRLAFNAERFDDIRVRIRGADSGAARVVGDVEYPVSSSTEEFLLSASAEFGLKLGPRWSSREGIAMIGSHSTGDWSGDFAMYTGKVPDSSLDRVRVLPGADLGSLRVRLSIGSATGPITSEAPLRTLDDSRTDLDATIPWQRAHVVFLNAHGQRLSRVIEGTILGPDGSRLASWQETPDWLDMGSDSVLPKLWASSVMPTSAIFGNRSLATLFGVTDSNHSLLASGGDTVGEPRRSALLDHGLPWLSMKDILPGIAYVPDGCHPDGLFGRRSDWVDGVIKRARRQDAPRVTWTSGARSLRISLEGLEAQGIAIRDLKGRALALFPADQLENRKALEWTPPAGLGRGMLLVSVRTSTGLKTASVMMN